MLEADMDKNIETIDETILQMNRIKKSVPRRKQKHQHHRELSLRLNELYNSKTEIRKKIDALKQIISLIEDVKEQVKMIIKELKKKIKNIPKANPFDFTDYVEKQKEDIDIDLGLFLELAEENKITYNQTPVNTFVK